jgi:hypothetical protein
VRRQTDLVGTKFKIVSGYPGGNEITLALEKGAAFDAMASDPELLAEAARQSLDVDRVSGAEMQTLVERFYRAPPDVVDLVQKINGAR